MNATKHYRAGTEHCADDCDSRTGYACEATGALAACSCPANPPMVTPPAHACR